MSLSFCFQVANAGIDSSLPLEEIIMAFGFVDASSMSIIYICGDALILAREGCSVKLALKLCRTLGL